MDCGKIELRFNNAKVCLDCSLIRRDTARKASKIRNTDKNKPVMLKEKIKDIN
jgi:hypothetical protein